MNGCHGIRRIAVSTDGIGVFLRHDCTADHNLCIRLLFTEQADGLFHADDRRRHQGTETHQRDVLADRRLHNGLRGNILSQVKDFEAVVFQHDLDYVFADIVDISLDSGQDDPALCLLFLVLHGLFDDFKGRFGRLRAHEQLRKENGTLFKAFADKIQGGDQFLINEAQSRSPRFEKGSGSIGRAPCHASADAVSQGHSCRRLRGTASRHSFSCLFCRRRFRSPAACGVRRACSCAPGTGFCRRCHGRSLCIGVGLDVAHTLRIQV